MAARRQREAGGNAVGEGFLCVAPYLVEPRGPNAKALLYLVRCQSPPKGPGCPQSVPGLTLAWESWLYALFIPMSRWESGKHLEGPRNPGKMVETREGT